MPVEDSAIFRKAALDRLASAERLDERLELPTAPPALRLSAILLAACAAAFAIWLLLRP
jgi:ABC-type uncharacterized transport system permease subunit